MSVRHKRQPAAAARKPKVAGLYRASPGASTSSKAISATTVKAAKTAVVDAQHNTPNSGSQGRLHHLQHRITAIFRQAAHKLKPERKSQTVPRAEAAQEPESARKVLRSRVLLLVIMLLLTGVFVGLGLWFQAQAQRLTGAPSAVNQALVDTSATADAVTKIRQALETVSSYKYSDLDADQKAGQAVVAGNFATEYDALFKQIRAQAPAQKAVVTTQVALIGANNLQGDQAVLFALMTQTTAKTNVNQSYGLAVTVHAERIGGQWKITELTPR